MTRLVADDMLAIAKTLYRQSNRRVYFHIPETYAVERSNLKFSHFHVHEKDDHIYHIPIYNFNNKLYVHSAPIYALGEGHKVGPTSATGAHYYPSDD